MNIFFACCLLVVGLTQVESKGLKEEFTWTRINYVWPQESRFGYGGYRPYRPQAPADNDGIAFPGPENTQGWNKYKGKTTTTTAVPPPPPPSPEGDAPTQDVEYIHENNIPMGANRWGDKLFITVPRRRNGVPSTLNYISMSSKERHNVPLIPYPDWETNQLSAPIHQRLVSVYRVAVDACDRLWMIDTGIIEIPGNRTDLQKHTIVIIDLKTDKIIKKYTLKDSDMRPPTILALITIDVASDKCDDAYAYLPDLAGYGLIVYSLKQDDSWRVSHNYFFLEPLAGDFDIGGHKFQWTDGIFSAALSDIKSDGYRDMYFHSMAGTNLYTVSTEVLRNRDRASRSYHENDFKSLGNRGDLQQTSASDLHKKSSVLFLSLVNQNALGCYDTNKPFSPANFDIVQKDDQKMIYPCDLKVYKDDVILLTNNMPIFLYGQLNYNETNFRVWMNSVDAAVEGTVCDPKTPAKPEAGDGKGKGYGYRGKRTL